MANLQTEYDALQNKYNALQTEYDALQTKYSTLQSESTALEDEATVLKTANSELEVKLADAEPWFQLSEIERQKEEQRLAEEKAAQEEAERLAAEKATAEAEAKEKQGYNTGITYSQLARTPDDYVGEKVKFYGKVIQVLEGGVEVDLRIATSGEYDDVILVCYPPSLVASRVLEDDYITIYGISDGLYTYQSTMGGNITIPIINVEKIER